MKKHEKLISFVAQIDVKFFFESLWARKPGERNERKKA